MVRSHSFVWILVSLLSLTLAASLKADITPSGDVNPTDYLWWIGGGDSSTDAYIGKTASGSVIVNLDSDLSSFLGFIGYEVGATGVVTVDDSDSTWTNSSSLIVGYEGQGTLNITNGGTVSNTSYGYIGYDSGATGVVTVDGIDSTWTNSGNLYVGNSGQGTLNITNGGAVNVTGDTWVARNDGAAGEIHFEGGTLTTKSLFAGATQLTGTGTINTHGLVSDVDMLFDSAHGPNQTIMLNSQPGQNITINLTQGNIGKLGVGYAGNGTLAIRDGVSVESYEGYIGYEAGATGEVTVDSIGSTWTNSSRLYIGDSGQGTLNITNGGAVSNSIGIIGDEAGSTGEVTVDGSGSIWTNSDRLFVGRSGQGTLNITNGGAVSNSGGYYGSNHIGYEAEATGVVTVDGSGSTWTDSDYFSLLYVGCSGQGTLNITNGGAVSNSIGIIGDEAGSTGEVTVDGSGSIWTTSDRLFVGRSGQGTLNITNGGAVSNSWSGIGDESGSTGEVTVDGSGSIWTNKWCLYVGTYGQGTLNITNGGAVSNYKGYIGYYSGSTGEVTVDGNGSTWTCSDILYVGGSYRRSGGTGELTVSNGGSVEVGDVLKVWDGGTLNIGATGTVTVGGTMILVQDSTLLAEPGATIHMTGSAFENKSTNPDNLAGLGNLTLIFEGGSEDIDPFEVAGEDMGAVMDGLEDNFALGTLQLGGDDIGYVQLVDNFDNRPDWTGSEAIYVENLIIGAGSTLDLNGLNLYYLNGMLDGTVVDSIGDGGAYQIPEPASATILLLGTIAVLRRRKK